ncbi:MAG: N-acetyl sugar amidotransferase [Cyclobacteriaceae bacterium]
MERDDVGYLQCVRCVLDNKDDPQIIFDSSGICNYCLDYDLAEKQFVKSGETAKSELTALVSMIKKSGEGRRYDCVLGVSGGVDSSYLALIAKDLGLRVLAVHFDNGWNSELAVKNIESMLAKLGIDLFTFVVDWNEFRDLQLALLKASVVDIELATDHAMLAVLYQTALDQKIKYILSGHNVVSEQVLPKHWYFDKRDHIHIRAINQRFGTIPLKTYPLLNSWLKFSVVWNHIKSVTLLNYLDYNKEAVKKTLVDRLGWRDYGGKHYESVFTRFYQGYILPTKFGIDKRRAHLSNLICSKQLTRKEALKELEKPPYSPDLFEVDYEFVLKKLNLSAHEFERLMQAQITRHEEYPIDSSIYDRYFILKLISPIWRLIRALREKLAR